MRNSTPSQFSFAIVAGGLLGFVVLGSGVWYPKAPAGGRTQVGRTTTVAFEDGSVTSLTESENDLDILKKRRMKGYRGHEYQQIFIMADGEEIEVTNDHPKFVADGEGLSTGDHLLLAANTVDASEEEIAAVKKGSAVVADLQINGKDRHLADEIDGKDRVITDLIDGKDQVYTDPKDAKDVTEQPVFALTADQSPYLDDRLDMLLIGNSGGSLGDDLGSLRTVSGDPGTGSISAPPIGGAVPEPAALPLIVVAGALGLTFKAWRRRVAA